MTAPNHAASQLLTALFAQTDRAHYIEFRLIGAEGPRQCFVRVSDGLRHGLPARIAAADGAANFYFSAIPRTRPRGRGEDCGPAVAAWADFDAGVPQGLPLAPSVVVESSPGKAQAFWLTTGLCSDLRVIEAINRRIAADYGADPHACDRARVLRFPGFRNLKYAAQPRAQLLRCSPEVRYPIEELRRAFPPAEKAHVLRRESASAPRYLVLIFEAILRDLEARGARWRRSGEGVLICCPLHDDREPSLSIHPERGWHCFAGCGSGRLTALAHRLNVTILERA